ncbi:MAG: alpha/beta fold hydrolase [Acidobacteria bacterium]|nr:alpha/beta fold hydrolase [Acidobacteriota bacterium]
MDTLADPVKLEKLSALQASPATRETETELGGIARVLESKPFRPHPLFRNSHAQTLIAYKWPRRRRLREESRVYEPRLFEVEPNVRLLAHCRWQDARHTRPTVVLVHGLEGSTASVYMMGTAQKAFQAGFNVVSLNMRNCGGTEHLAHTLYHSGMSGDVHAVVGELVERDGLASVFVAGFSMGGNIVLKFAGEFGPDAPRQLQGVCAVSPSLDLSACADAIERRTNRLYQRAFVHSLRQRIRGKQKLHPDIYDTSRLHTVRTVRDFDNLYTAVHGGFKDAADYYERVSALRFIPRISVPTLIIHAQDDPIIPFSSFRDPAIAANPHVVLLASRHGGHVGFVADSSDGEDRFWAENRIVEFFRLISDERMTGACP